MLSLYEENLFSGGAFALDICCSFSNISINQKTVSFSLPFTLFNSYNLSVSSIKHQATSKTNSNHQPTPSTLSEMAKLSLIHLIYKGTVTCLLPFSSASLHFYFVFFLFCSIFFLFCSLFLSFFFLSKNII